MSILRKVNSVDGLKVKVTVLSKEDQAGVVTYMVIKEYNHPLGEHGLSQQYDVFYHMPEDSYFTELCGCPLSEFDVLSEEDFRKEVRQKVMAI